jgi:hypothetical protein
VQKISTIEIIGYHVIEFKLSSDNKKNSKLLWRESEQQSDVCKPYSIHSVFLLDDVNGEDSESDKSSSLTDTPSLKNGHIKPGNQPITNQNGQGDTKQQKPKVGELVYIYYINYDRGLIQPIIKQWERDNLITIKYRNHYSNIH